MPIGHVLTYIRQLHALSETVNKPGSNPNPSGRAASTRVNAATTSAVPAEPTATGTASAAKERIAAGPSEGASSPPDDVAAPDAAVVSLGMRLGKIPLESWWDGDGDGVSVDARAAKRGQSISIQLSLPELGPISVVLMFYDGGMRTQIVVDSATAADRMTALLPRLRLSLTELFRVEEIRVVLRPPPVATNTANPQRIVDMHA